MPSYAEIDDNYRKRELNLYKANLISSPIIAAIGLAIFIIIAIPLFGGAANLISGIFSAGEISLVVPLIFAGVISAIGLAKTVDSYYELQNLEKKRAENFEIVKGETISGEKAIFILNNFNKLSTKRLIDILKDQKFAINFSDEKLNKEFQEKIIQLNTIPTQLDLSPKSELPIERKGSGMNPTILFSK